MRQRVIAFLTAGALLLSQASATASDTDESTIEKTYNAWVRATNAKDIDMWSSYLAPDALFQPPGIHPLDTREAILEYYRSLFADPNFALDCQQLAVEVADSKQMAWARGICRATFTNPDGQAASGVSRWLKVWIKLPDGSWKCRANTWNYELNELTPDSLTGKSDH
jgi:ketosteroid isomerase-like protein